MAFVEAIPAPVSTTSDWRAEMKAARGRLGMTQVQLAQRVNVSQNIISKIEKGHVVSSAAVPLIAKVLKIELPRYYEDKFEHRWADVGRRLRELNPGYFEQQLATLEEMARALSK